MRKIFTFTGNLLAESRARFASHKTGETVRAIGEIEFQVGGKGVNVARAANFLGIPAAAAIFYAGFAGRRCLNALKEENLGCVIPVELDGETREGLVCVDDATAIETTYLGSDIPIPGHKFDSSLQKISRMASSGDILAFCGSCPGWQKGYAEKIRRLCAKKNLRLCIDTYSAPLADLIRIKSDLVKINRRELFSLLGEEDPHTDAAFESAFERLSEIADTHCLAASDGPNPAILKVRGRKSVRLKPPKIKREISATGCGDLLLAAFIAQNMFKNVPEETAFKRALKVASISASSPNIIGITRERAREILKF